MRSRIVEEDLKFITDADLPWEQFSGKTVLISGAAGNLAFYMVNSLMYLNEQKKANIRIVGLVRDRPKAEARYASSPGCVNPEFIEQDVCDEITFDDKIDFIIHMASPASPKIFHEDPVGTILPNVIGTRNLLDLAVRKKVEGFLLFSTTGVMGFLAPEDYPATEDRYGGLDSMAISSCYLESKRIAETMCVAWMQQYGVPVKVIRPAITYGPGVDLDGGRSYEDLIAAIVNRTDIKLYSDGSAIRNFCYIADATLGFFTVMLKGTVGEAYNVATDEETSIKDLAENLAYRIFPERNLRVIFETDDSKDYPRTNFSRTTVDIGKAKALGWRLSWPLDEGFKRVVRSCEGE
jgi:UDP-glucuronate decarboxylase